MTRYTVHAHRPKFDGTEQKRRIRLGKLLRDAREDAGYIQAVVAPMLGYKHQCHISQIENGNRTLDPIELENFARMYGKTLNDFATWRDDQPTTEELRRRAEELGRVISEKQSAARDSRRGRKPKMTAKEKEQRKQHFDALARRLFEAQAIKKSGEKSEP